MIKTIGSFRNFNLFGLNSPKLASSVKKFQPLIPRSLLRGSSFIFVLMAIYLSTTNVYAKEIDMVALSQLMSKADKMEIKVYFKSGETQKGKPFWDGKCIRLKTRNVIGNWTDTGCLDANNIRKIVIHKESKSSPLKYVVLVAGGILFLSWTIR